MGHRNISIGERCSGEWRNFPREIRGRWFVRRGADEVLTSPLAGREATEMLCIRGPGGPTVVDHYDCEFHPVDDGFETRDGSRSLLKHFGP